MMDFTSVLKRLFIFILFLFAFVLLALYTSETKSYLSTPYLSHIQNYVKNGKSLVATFVNDNNQKPHIEESWTYECERNRCIRKFYSDKNKTRITFLTCAMVCSGNANLWPKPSMSTIKKSVTNFRLSDVQYKIETEFDNVRELLHKAMLIFVDDIGKITKVVDEKVVNETNTEETDVNSTSTISTDVIVNINLHVLESKETTLTLSSDECYKLEIKRESSSVNINISGKTFFGVRHGLESLQQIIWYDDAESSLKILDSVNVNDCPKFNYRGLMLDTSRHYFSVDTIKRLIVGMSHVKLNRFHWHITDSQSFPFVSQNYPELSQYGAYSSSEVYTHADINEIVEFAEVRGIQIIPEIDAPAHAGNGWQWGNEKGLGELSLCINQQPWMQYCGEPSCGQLNPRNNNTYLILEKLYEELLTLTKTTDYFHLGGDEVNFGCWQQHFQGADLGRLWCEFMMKAHDLLMSANKNDKLKIATIWNSDWSKMKCLPPEKFAIQIWLASASQMKQLLNANYNIIVSHVDAWYLDCGFGTWRSTYGQGSCPPFKAWYTVYNHRPWSDKSIQIDENQMKQILGGEACMWTEQVDENSVDIRVWPRGIALAERLWSDPKGSMIPKETVSRFSIFHTRFLELGLKSDALFPKYCEQNQEECF